MVAALPHVTAALNALAGILLCIGFGLVRTHHTLLHRRVMTAAVATSALFLVSYVLHHLTAPVFVFPGQGLVRPLYFTMLVSHVTLAVLVTPLVVVTFWRGRTGRLAGHRRLARWTFPIWLYVSVTGIAVYVLLYHVYRPEV